MKYFLAILPAKRPAILHHWQRSGIVLRVAIACLVVMSSALAPALVEPVAAVEVAGNADVPLVEFLDLGSCADPNLGVTAGGVGLFQNEIAGSFAITLPVGATPEDAFVFWNGATFSDSAGDSIIDFTDPLNGLTSLSADQSYGGATWEPGSFGATHFAWSYRSGVDYSGSGTYSLAGVGAIPTADFDVYANGAGMMALFRDPTLGARRIKAAHGLDLMQGPTFPTAGPGGEKLIFDFDAESLPRTADLITIVGGVFPGQTSSLAYIAGSGPVTATVPSTQTVATTPGATVINNPFQSGDGLRWDTYAFQATIPANAEWVMIQLESVLTNPADPLSGPRLEWIAQSFSLPLECPDLGDQTFIDWNNNGVYDGNDEPFPTDITVSLEGNVNGYSNTDTATGGQDNGNYLFEDLPVGLSRPGESNSATYTATVPAQTGYTPTTLLEQVRSITYPGPDVLDVDFGFLPDSDVAILKLAGDAPDGTSLILDAATTVTYTYVVTNTGLTYLTPVTVTDDVLGFICEEPGPVAPGQSFTCQRAALVSGDVTNIGSATGTPSGPGGTPIPPGEAPVNPPSDSDDAVVEFVGPGIRIVKTAGDAADGEVFYIDAAGPVTYTYAVTNTGDTYLVDITVVDDNGTPAETGDDFQVCVEAGPLAPGGSFTCTATRTVSDDRINIASASGQPSDDDGIPLPDVDPVSDTDDAEVELVSPAVRLIKLAGDAPDGGVFLIGEPQVVTYTYIVENTGDTYLAGMIIVDDNGTPGNTADDVTITSLQCPGLAGPLAPAGSLTCTFARQVASDTVNIAVVTATPSDDQGDPLPGIPPVEDQDDAEVALRNAIGDFVWYDADGDGIEDVGEPGIPNVRMALYEDTDGSGDLTPGDTLVMTTTTGADGGYLFTDLPPGDYIVDVMDATNPDGPLNGLIHTANNQSQPDPTAVISLAGGEVYKDADFGYVQQTTPGTAVIGDTVWYDENGDGVQQPGEVGIPGVQVCATPAGGGTPICDVTDSNGNYLLIVLAGSYEVTPTNPPGGLTATTLVPHSATVAEGDQYLDADFGYTDDGTVLGRIGNLVFEDANNNGVYDAGDRPLGSVSVDLIRDDNGDGVWQDGEPIIATVTTSTTVDGETGNYLFPGVPAGDYLVHVSDTNAVLFDYVKSQLGTAGLDNNHQVDPYAITLAAGGENLTADFGYRKPGLRLFTGVIGNQVWIETDEDGIFDPGDGDFGQPGVTVALYQSGRLYATTTTGASGDYSFVGLPAGTYTVTVTDQFGVLAGYQITTLGPDQGNDNNNQAQPYTVILPEDGENLTGDFGYTLPPPPPPPIGALGDYVWNDANDDGIQGTHESGIVGVLVCLYNDIDQNGSYTPGTDTAVDGAGDQPSPNSNCTLTGSNGDYIFTGLAAGNYIVKVMESNFLPAQPLFGCRASPRYEGADAELDSDGDSIAYDAPWQLQFDQEWLGVDFGYDCEPTPVQLLAGETYVRELNEVVKVYWATSNETNILGFNVLRSSFPDLRLARQLNTAMLPARGGAEDTYYQFTDANLAAEATDYLYWIEVIEADGSTSHPVPPMKVVLTRDRTIFVPAIVR